MSLDIYVMAGSYESEPFASTHIQRKGALIAAILDICEYLGIEDDDAVECLRDFREEDRAALIYDGDLLKKMDTEQLTKVFGVWSDREQVWQNDDGYTVTIIKTRLSA